MFAFIMLPMDIACATSKWLAGEPIDVCTRRASARGLTRFLTDMMPVGDGDVQFSRSTVDALAEHVLEVTNQPAAEVEYTKQLLNRLFGTLSQKQRMNLRRILLSGIAETLNMTRDRVKVQWSTSGPSTEDRMLFQYETNRQMRNILTEVARQLYIYKLADESKTSRSTNNLVSA